jgi:hypothetical protein
VTYNPYSVDDIVAAVRLGNLTYAAGEDALLRLGVQNPPVFLPVQFKPHPVRVARSALLPAPRVDQFGRGDATFVDGWRQVR